MDINQIENYYLALMVLAGVLILGIACWIFIIILDKITKNPLRFLRSSAKKSGLEKPTTLTADEDKTEPKEQSERLASPLAGYFN